MPGVHARELDALVEERLGPQRPGARRDHRAVQPADLELAALGALAQRGERVEVGIADVVDDQLAAALERVREVPLVERLDGEPG
jgi:hypothetical protein